MLQPKLGASLHTIEKNLTPEALAAVEGSRIATVEIHPMLFAADAEGTMRAALKEMLARAGIRPMTIHAPFGGAYDLSCRDEKTRQAGLQVVLDAIDLAAEFDAPMVVVHPSAEPIPAEEREERLARSRQSLARVGRRCAETGRRVALSRPVRPSPAPERDPNAGTVLGVRFSTSGDGFLACDSRPPGTVLGVRF
ncbi:MAG: TIM barrel protein [Propionibacterium sp.]|nr:TIM barrel protein [Propionibacterium sp.]